MMSNKKMFNDVFSFAQEMRKNISKEFGDLNEKLNQLPTEQREKIAGHQAELNNALKAVESGSIEDLQKIIQKHADTNN